MNFSFVKRFLKLESASGILLLIATLFALILANSPFSQFYFGLFTQKVSFSLGNVTSANSLQFWINEGLMTFFFLMITLELKRECLIGRFTQIKKILLPGLAALGGMIVPALIYIFVNMSHPETLIGWSIPVATDIAFALGVLSLFGKRVPLELKLFLMALAIFDDVGAIIIIALFHTKNLSYFLCLLILITVFLLFIANFLKLKRLILFAILGFILWSLLLNSGLHATIAGVLLAFFIPLDQVKQLETKLHSWVGFFITPLFAFSNAGFSVLGFTSNILFDYVTMGIILGLVVGKPLGVLSFTWLPVRLGLVSLPFRWHELISVSFLCGIGFTMSLFLGALTFEQSHPYYWLEVRIGVLVGSTIAGLIGATILYIGLRNRSLLKRN